ncbi:MAG TPA: hypothetical protein ENI95_14115 [Chloroflexi bacterium]|nr:hypothetical protein [Chloroflexota bacterium]
MTASLRRLSGGFLAAFAVIALALGYWSVMRRDSLIARDDNPRRVLEEQRIRRGQIVDRNGEPLADTLIDPDSDTTTRIYPHPEAAPVVGYYSLRYGVGGIEGELDDILRGDATLTPSERVLNQLLHRPQTGGDVQLTIDIMVQRAVQEALGTQRGAVVVLSVPAGEVLALGSQPTFDPNALEERWDELSADPEAPLLSRATQGLYQPGTILQSVILGAALNAGAIETTEMWEGDLEVPVNGVTLPCSGDPQAVSTLSDAYIQACPAPFQSIAWRLNARRLDGALADFGLLEAPAFTLPTSAADLTIPPAQANLALTAIGQSDLTISPLQMALVATAFANQGQMPALQLVRATRLPGGEWQPVSPTGNPRGTISPASVESVAGLMRQSVLSGAAQAATLPGRVVYGHSGLAIAGPEGSLNAWFIGFTYVNEGEAIAVAVLIEDAHSADVAARVGAEALRAALTTLP